MFVLETEANFFVLNVIFVVRTLQFVAVNSIWVGGKFPTTCGNVIVANN